MSLDVLFRRPLFIQKDCGVIKMKLPESLVSDFAKLVSGNNARNRNQSTFVYGTAQVDEQDNVSVIFDGADTPTPVSTTVGVKTGDRVMVLIRNHAATIMSNITSPVATFEAITAKYADLGGFISVSGDTEHEGKTSAEGGHAHRTSLYVHNSDDTYEYEAGLKGDARDSAYVAFYIKRMPKGQAWSSSSYMFYVNNSGKLYAQNADITGKITATSGSFKGEVTATSGSFKGEVTATKFKATWAGTTVTDILASAELTGQGLVIGSKYTGYGNYYVHLYPEQTYWSKSKDTPEASQHVAINYGGIEFSKPSYGDYVIEMRVSDGRIATMGEIYSKANIKSRSESTGAYTNIHANSVDVYIPGDNSKGRIGRFTSSAAGNIGLYDVDNANYIIYSNSSFEVHSNHKFYCQGQADTTERMPIGSSNTSNQKVGWIGCTATGTMSVRAQWNSSTWATKTLTTSSSDVRLKRDISDTKVRALDVLSKIRMREFTWKEDGVHQPLGVIADELEKIDPLFVVGGGEDENGEPIYKSIDVLYLLSYCVKAIQELKGDHDDGR